MRPAKAIITSKLPVSGIKYQWDLEQVREKGHRDAGSASMLAVVAWADREAFKREVVGYSSYRIGEATLRRTLPLAWPFDFSLWCDDYELESFGAYETRKDFAHDPKIDSTPEQDWARYLLTFTRPLYPVRTDGALAILYGGKEQYRFTTMTEMPRPRERIVSGFGFEYFSPTTLRFEVVPDEREFIPDYQIDIVTTWIQVPVTGVPYTAIYDTLNCVNSDVIQLEPGGRFYNPEELLFKGMGKPFERYFGADADLYKDLPYLFTFQPGTWNKHLTRDAAGNRFYTTVRRRADGLPPYLSRPFQKLFIPNSF